jgi:mono/diheme cytochrome c family protein
LPADREKFGTVMPPFAILGDAEVADVATYIRKQFASGAEAVTPAEVAAIRGRL